MFPYVCLATMPLFCRADWPRRLGLCFKRKQKILSINANSIGANNVEETDSQARESMKPNCSELPSNKISRNEATHEGKHYFFPIINNSIRALKYLQLFSERATSVEKNKNDFVKLKSEGRTDEKDNGTHVSKNSAELNEKEATSIYKKVRMARQSPRATRKQKFVASLLLCHIVLQLFLPYSHFISKVLNLSTSLSLNCVTPIFAQIAILFLKCADTFISN